MFLNFVLGGPNGVKDWEELLTQGETRRALAIGIIGRALKEHVFGDLWFGALPVEKNMMSNLEESEKFKDSLDGKLIVDSVVRMQKLSFSQDLCEQRTERCKRRNLRFWGTATSCLRLHS